MKRYISKCIISQKFRVQTAFDFAEICAKGCKGIQVFYVEKEQINEMRTLLCDNWSSVKKNLNLLSKHHFEVHDNELICSTVQGSKYNVLKQKGN